MRFLLDAHPDLACPPETNLPALCAQLATVWSLIEGAPLSGNRGDEPPVIPDAAIAGIRETMDRMVGSYLERRRKKRYCDKSLGTAHYAELLLRVYPEARFICLYRHPMDVIASGMEACPWGLNGYGFDPYIAATPGNTVLALGRFWADNVSQMLAAEEQSPGQCIRVRYEDLVTDPEGTAARVFEFLGAPPAPGVSRACFSAERERFGPGDHKIWYTSAITPGSVGRGWSVPMGLIAPPVLATINELAGKLGYLQIDGSWGNSAPPADLRVPVTPTAADVAADGQADPAAPNADTPSVPVSASEPAPAPVHSGFLGTRLEAGLARAGQEGAQQWGQHGMETLVAVSIPADPQQAAEHWLVDLKNHTVALATAQAQDSSDWDVIGSTTAWEQVVAGKLNLSAALRSCQLRYCDSDDSGGPLAADTRLALLADLLAIARWQGQSA